VVQVHGVIVVEDERSRGQHNKHTTYVSLPARPLTYTRRYERKGRRVYKFGGRGDPEQEQQECGWWYKRPSFQIRENEVREEEEEEGPSRGLRAGLSDERKKRKTGVSEGEGRRQSRKEGGKREVRARERCVQVQAFTFEIFFSVRSEGRNAWRKTREEEEESAQEERERSA